MLEPANVAHDEYDDRLVILMMMMMTMMMLMMAFCLRTFLAKKSVMTPRQVSTWMRPP